MRRLGWLGQTLLAAGRTDTGVHASGQVIAFDLDWKHSPESLQAALNANLPPDVAAQAVAEAAPDFHPRYHARSRHYRYHLFCQPRRDPLRERYAWRVWPAVDPELLQQAASYLLGTHDFAAFGTPPRAGGSTIRRVSRAEWQAGAEMRPQDDSLTFDVEANAFLYHMVRRLVNFQVQIGQGWFKPEAVHERLTEARTMVQGLAPPQGLVLVEVRYDRSAVSGTASGFDESQAA